MNRTALLTTALMAALLGGTFGCRSAKKDPRENLLTAPMLLAQADGFLQRGKWEDARRALRQIEEYLPSTPEYPAAKLKLADSFFFQSSTHYPEAIVEYQSFLNYFPRHERRDYALYRLALCHYAAIESAERDQAETRRALDAFQNLIRETPGSPYVVDARAKVTQCWRRLAEHELVVGIHYVSVYHFAGAERRLKELMETYPDHVDRERAYYFLGEALRRKQLTLESAEQFQKGWLARKEKDDLSSLSREEFQDLRKEMDAFRKEEETKYRAEARSFFERLVESYPASEWAGRARDRLIEMGQSNVKEELDS
ncbi:MAG: Outer membrane protein assembly factor BamD precursor [Acidobacteria bacterium ADurb.Bin340]|nr:MAG: Outer membrane protein assembly factor BamD precursor [Acidobacteria bacterium ADurb.Bin340]HOD33094.1 outer membrane protein assembly factor BamD [Holophaga sp.]